MNAVLSTAQVERYEFDGNQIHRFVMLRSGKEVKTTIPSKGEMDFDSAWLKWPVNENADGERQVLKLADLFCGTGPMSLGVIEAAKALDIEVIPTFAVDLEPTAAHNYALNFPTADVITDDITKLLNGECGCAATPEEAGLISRIGRIDFMIAGPPCQGHSDLNNHTRRDDPRNMLILKACRFVELFMPKYVIIENVQGIRHDKNGVLNEAKEILANLGYNLSEHLLMASKYGVAQNRRRFLLVGSLDSIDVDLSHYEKGTAHNVMWAISDLAAAYDDNETFNSAAIHSKTNQERIDYLFDHDMHDLPYQQRPKCQRKPTNRYTSVYGRMYPDRPAPTITSGFGSIGQGRFCHPLQRRTLTPHEAARVQFIPDYFKFSSDLSRVALQKMIGNAVPPKLTYIIGLELLR